VEPDTGIARAPSGPARGIHRAVVIDDDATDRAQVRRELGRVLGDVEVTEISQRSAFERFLEAPAADVVITDCALGWSDGIAVVRDVKSRLPEAIVIMFTATGSEEIAVEAMKSGVDDYVLKSASHYGRLGPALMSAADRLAHRRLLRAAQHERDLALERERHAREQAERASRLKDEFLATVSHELRTPLNAILGWAHIARSLAPPTDEKLTRALATIERNARAQSTLIEDLLDVSRIVAGLVRIHRKPIDARDVLSAAIDVARPAADAKGTSLRARIAAEPLAVLADPDRLQQVLWNLLSNAVRFTPAGGTIDVEAEPARGRAVITVRDSGAGIAPHFLPHVFEPFRQADQSTTRAHGGLGIGLAIARRLVELHGGEISAHSEGEGRGASFRVELPMAVDGAEEPFDASERATEARSTLP
jgi:signal transduction histidine kinase